MDILNTAPNRLADWQRIVEMRLDQETSASPQVPAQLTGSIRHSVLGSAKRVRAMIVLALAADLGHDESRFLSTASAIEMVHAASLVLDDLPCMDDAKQRRGQTTTHRAYGDANAILAAIALIARAYEVIAQDTSLHAGARTKVLRMLAAAMGREGLTGGQVDDLDTSRVADTDHLIGIYRRKTSALFTVSLEAPSVIADLDDARRMRLAEAGRQIGVAFQIYDDLIDVLSTSAIAGKDVRADTGKVTMVSLLGPAAAARRADHEIAGALSQIEAVLGHQHTAGFIRHMAQRAHARIEHLPMPAPQPS